jgi:hypothetical protein
VLPRSRLSTDFRFSADLIALVDTVEGLAQVAGERAGG